MSFQPEKLCGRYFQPSIIVKVVMSIGIHMTSEMDLKEPETSALSVAFIAFPTGPIVKKSGMNMPRKIMKELEYLRSSSPSGLSCSFGIGLRPSCFA